MYDLLFRFLVRVRSTRQFADTVRRVLRFVIDVCFRRRDYGGFHFAFNWFALVILSDRAVTEVLEEAFDGAAIAQTGCVVFVKVTAANQIVGSGAVLHNEIGRCEEEHQFFAHSQQITFQPHHLLPADV